MERQNIRAFANCLPRKHGRADSMSALKIAAIATMLTMTSGVQKGIPLKRFAPVDEPQETEFDDEPIANQRAAVQSKRHKKKRFHVQTKHQPSATTLAFFERVTDPHKEERLTEFLKDPFRGLNHR